MKAMTVVTTVVPPTLLTIFECTLPVWKVLCIAELIVNANYTY